MNMPWRLTWVAIFGMVLATTAGVRVPQPRLLYGPLVGDLTASAAVIWCRVEGLSQVTCELRSAAPRGETTVSAVRPACPWRSSGATFDFQGLLPATDYEIAIPELSPRPLRRFRTAPASTADAVPLRIAFTADVGGQHIGRDAERGFPGFPVIAARRPDCFVGLGDMIYADKYVPSRGRLGNRQVPLANSLLLDRRDFGRHWSYLHADSGFAALLAQTSYVATWDDHECCSDTGPEDNSSMLAMARREMFAWNPVNGTADEPQRLYRALRLGPHCELFVLDCRSYRDPMEQLDDGPEPKTMLGAAQREWLLRALGESDAAWKIIVSSQSLACPSGSKSHGYGGWTDNGTRTAYEREMLELMRGIQRLGIRRPIFLTADVHHAEVLDLAPFDDAPGFRPVEVTVGPMNAGLFGRYEQELDPRLHPKSLFYLSGPTPTSLAEATRSWNFGVIEIGTDAALRLQIVTVAGDTVYQRELAPEPCCGANARRASTHPR